MRALISGSTGFIGSALVAALRADGVEVHRIVRRRPAAGEVGIDLAARRLDTSAVAASHRSGADAGALEGFDVVYHLAGEPLTPRRWGPAKLERIRASRIVTTDLLARAIATSSDPSQTTLVSMSATGYYGSRPGELLDEESAGGRGFLAEVCRGWEAATMPARDAGARVVNLRMGVVLGPGGGALEVQRRLFSLGVGGRLGDGSQHLAWISLADAIGALRHSAATPALIGPVNGCAPEPVTNLEFTAALGRALRRPTPFRVPRAVLVAAIGRRSAEEFVLADQRVRPRRLEESGYRFTHRDLAACLAWALSTGR